MQRVRDASGICSRLHAVICPSGNFVSSPVCKNISVSTHPKSLLELRYSTPPEGRIAIVTDAGRDAVDAAAFCCATCSAQNQMTPRATSAPVLDAFNRQKL